jgi:predicted Zn-dependent protease
MLLSGAACHAQTTTAAAAPTVTSIRHAIDTGHPDAALQQIASLRVTDPKLPGLSREEGMALYAKGNLMEAQKAFAAAVAADTEDLEATQMDGLTLFQMGRPADAIPLLERSRKSPIVKADPNYLLALCYMDTRRYDDARRAFAAQYGFDPETAPAYLVAARMLFRREYTPIAQSFAEKSLQLDPSLPLAHELLGEIALAGGHLDEAIAELEKERVRNPLEGIVYERLGDAYVRAGKYDHAQRVLQQAVLLEPGATAPYILMGKTLLKKGDAIGSVTVLDHARAMDPANYITHSLLAQAYRALGRSDDASREVQIAEKLQAASEPKIQGVK